MYILKKLTLVIFFLIVSNNLSFASQNVRFADIDLIVQNSEIGKKTLSKIEKINKSNIEKLTNFQKQLKDRENEIKIKKNIISEEEFKKEVENLKNQLAEFNKKKDLMVKEFSDLKKNELEALFDKINPIIQNYMKENSIEILMNSKNIFIGNINSDLTQVLINEINSKVENK
jgi:outer membrane protein